MEPLDLYYRVLKVANYFLENATSTGLSIESLKKLNPTVNQVARDLRLLAVILKEVAANDYSEENMAINAFQCCLIMEKLADAVAADREEALQELIDELEKHVNGGPY